MSDKKMEMPKKKIYCPCCGCEIEQEQEIDDLSVEMELKDFINVYNGYLEDERIQYDIERMCLL